MTTVQDRIVKMNVIADTLQIVVQPNLARNTAKSPNLTWMKARSVGGFDLLVDEGQGDKVLQGHYYAKTVECRS